jgi:hypothetical protein
MAGDEGSNRNPGDVDLDRLAERVQRLMLEELRLERARGTRPAPRGER